MNRSNLMSAAVMAVALTACSKEQAPEQNLAASESVSSLAVEIAGGNPTAEAAAKQITAILVRIIVLLLVGSSVAARDMRIIRAKSGVRGELGITS